MARRPTERSLALIFGAVLAMAVAACGSVVSEPEAGSEAGANNPVASPSASSLPVRPVMVLPTLAPVPATRNPTGLAPVKVATASARPAHLRIQAVGIDLPISEGALTIGRELAAPSDTLGVVWYRDGAKPGMRGNAVMTGHVDWQGQPGAFFRLKELVPGDIIQVYAADGTQYLYTVDSSETYRAESAPVSDIMGAKDIPLLTLITCDGTFDYSKQDYSLRRVVRAIWY